MRYILLPFCFILCCQYGCAQEDEKGCETYLDKQLKSLHEADNVELRQKDVAIIMRCGQFDEIDSIISLNPSSFATTIVDLSRNKPITYGNVISHIRKKIREFPNYALLKDEQGRMSRLRSMKFQTDMLDSASDILFNTGLIEDRKAFKEFAESINATKMTFQELYSVYNEQIKSAEPPLIRSFHFDTLSNFDVALIRATKETKPLLIYFTGRNSAASRKMEKTILNDPEICQMLTSDFIAYAAWVDLGTVQSEKLMQLQMEKFKTDIIPYFAILNDRGDVLSMLEYDDSPSAFKNFLLKQLK